MRTYLIEGVAKNSNNFVSTLYAGNEISAYQFASSIYSRIMKISPIGELLFRHIHQYVPKEFPGIVVVQVERPFATRFLQQGYLLLPNVTFVLDLRTSLNEMIRNMSRRRKDIRKLESYDYSCLICADSDEEFDHFYWKMYVPYAEKRFGKAAYIKTYLESRALYTSKGGIVFVKKQKKPVAGILFRVVGKTVFALFYGARGGDIRFGNDLSGQAALLHLIKWGKMKGLESLDFGTCGPFLRDGLFIYKKEWGMNIEEQVRQPVCALHLSHLSESSQLFLAQNPFIIIDNGVMKGLIFIDHSPTETELERIRSRHLIPKLHSLVVVSCPRRSQMRIAKTPAGQDPSSALSSVLRNLGLNVEVFELAR